MEHALITLASDLAIIAGSAYLGYLAGRQHYAHCNAELQHLADVAANTAERAVSLAEKFQSEIDRLRKKLARYHTLRDKKGRFTKRR